MLDRFGSPSVWFAFLGGPVIWAAHFLASYGLVSVPCAWQAPLFILVTIAAVLVVIAAASSSWRRLQQSPAAGTDAPIGGRDRFIGIAGVLNSLLFLIIILAQASASLVLGRCWT